MENIYPRDEKADANDLVSFNLIRSSIIKIYYYLRKIIFFNQLLLIKCCFGFFLERNFRKKYEQLDDTIEIGEISDCADNLFFGKHDNRYNDGCYFLLLQLYDVINSSFMY